MEETMLSINSPVQFDTSITNYEIHAHLPYGAMSYESSDEIRINIQNQDLYVLPSKSSLHITGRLTKTDNAVAPTTTKLVNNGILHLFEEIRYELNGVEIDKTKNTGITTTMKNFLSLSNKNNYENAGWIGTSDNTSLINDGYFDVCIPLQMILGFAEDYRKIIVNAKHELILVRSRNDSNATIGSAVTDEKTKIKIEKIEWMMPYVKLSDKKRVEMMKFIQRDPLISMSFRSFEMYEYPVLPVTNKHVWSVKTTTQLEKPRFVILGFQTNKKHQWNKNPSHFDHCDIRDVKLFLNSISYPYGNLNIDIGKKQIAVLYEMFMNFTESYYGEGIDIALSKNDFLSKAPFIVIDCSKQNEMLKYGPVDVRLEFETDTAFPPLTAAYCLILHDRIVEYKPISGTVQKLS